LRHHDKDVATRLLHTILVARPVVSRIGRPWSSTLDILFVPPRLEREDLGHSIPHQGADLAGAAIAAGGYVVDDILKPGPRMQSRSGKIRGSRKDRFA
jgi:hypothetical protein